MTHRSLPLSVQPCCALFLHSMGYPTKRLTDSSSCCFVLFRVVSCWLVGQADCAIRVMIEMLWTSEDTRLYTTRLNREIRGWSTGFSRGTKRCLRAQELAPSQITCQCVKHNRAFFSILPCFTLSIPCKKKTTHRWSLDQKTTTEWRTSMTCQQVPLRGTTETLIALQCQARHPTHLTTCVDVQTVGGGGVRGTSLEQPRHFSSNNLQSLFQPLL